MKYYLLSFLCILILLTACEIKHPALPVWDIELSIPLMNERYYVSDLIDSVYIVTDQNDLLQLVGSGELSTDAIFSISMQPAIEINSLPILAGAQPKTKLPLYDSAGKTKLSYGKISQGSLRYRFSGVHPGVEMITLSFPEIRNPAGNILQLNLSTQDWLELDLSGYSIGTYNQLEILDSLNVSISSVSEEPAGTPIAYFSLQMNTELQFSIFQGKIEHMELLALDAVSSLDVDYPHDIDQAITLSDASLIIELSNQLGFSCEFSGWFEGRRDDLVIRIPIVDDNGKNYIIPAATGDLPGTASLVFHHNISTLMQIMPQHIELVEAKFLIDCNSGFGTLRIDDIIHADYTIKAPFRFTLHEHPIEIDSVLTIEISEENRKRIRENLLDAGLQIQALNTIPLGGQVHAYFAAQPDIDISKPSSYAFVKSVGIHSGATHQDWQSLAPLSLSQDELLLFSEAKAYVKWVFSFEASPGLVEIHASTADYIALRGNLTATMRVKEL